MINNTTSCCTCESLIIVLITIYIVFIILFSLYTLKKHQRKYKKFNKFFRTLRIFIYKKLKLNISRKLIVIYFIILISIIPFGTFAIIYQLCLQYQQNNLIDKQNELSIKPVIALKTFDLNLFIEKSPYYSAKYFISTEYDGHSANTTTENIKNKNYQDKGKSFGFQDSLEVPTVNIGKGVAKNITYKFNFNDKKLIQLLNKFPEITVNIENNQIKTIKYNNYIINWNLKKDEYFEHIIDFLIPIYLNTSSNVNDNKIYLPRNYTSIFALLVKYLHDKDSQKANIGAFEFPILNAIIYYQDMDNKIHESKFEIKLLKYIRMYNKQNALLPMRVKATNVYDIIKVY